MAETADLDGLPELSLLEPGTEFGNYVVQECVGQGAMGSVYRAMHALLAKPVALKIMDSALLGSPEARVRFLREGRAAASIKHPNVVDITDVGFMGTTPYLVMELLEGEDLSAYLERVHRLSEDEMIELFMPIIAALSAAHDSGVVHRDLKPSNIFLAQGRDGDVDPKLLDFGISKLSSALANKNFGATPFNQLLGSPLYLPPEAVNGSGNMTPKSDQFSLGVVLYECLTGQPPFSGNTLLEVLNAISSGVFEKPRLQRPELSAEVENAILRAMDPDPARRFEHVRDLGRALIDLAPVRTQVRWGRALGRRDLSEAPRSLPASAHSVTAPRAQPRTARAVLAAGVLSLLAAVSWISWTAPKPAAAPAPAGSGAVVARQSDPAVAAPPPRIAAPAAAVPIALDAPAREPARTSGKASASPPDERERAAPPSEAGAKSRREVAARPVAAVEKPREAPPPRLEEPDELNPFAIPRRAPPPARRRPTVQRGANEAPILD